MIDISIRNYIIIYNSSGVCHNIDDRKLKLGFRKKLIIKIYSYVIQNNNINI